MTKKITLKEFGKIVERRSLSAYKILSALLTEEVIETTPRLSGSLVNSWTPNNGPIKANNVTIDVENPSPARVSFIGIIGTLKLGDTYSLGNGKPYAARIEFEGHSSLKAPAGMLRVSLARLDEFKDIAIRGSRT